MKLLPGLIKFTKGFSKWYTLLRQVLFETRLHHWLTPLEVITRPGQVLSIDDGFVSSIHWLSLRCTHMRCQALFVTTNHLFPLNMCIDIQKSLAHREEHTFGFGFKTSRFNQFFIFKSHVLPRSKISNQLRFVIPSDLNMFKGFGRKMCHF